MSATDRRARPSWDRTWMQVACTLARRSRCDGRAIGAVIVSADNAQVFVGYNGPPAGLDLGSEGRCSEWCPRMLSGEQTVDYANCYTAHAEANALIHADHSRIQGGTIYITSASCWECGKLIANSGISRVVQVLTQADLHRDPWRTVELMRNSGLLVDIFEE